MLAQPFQAGLVALHPAPAQDPQWQDPPPGHPQCLPWRPAGRPVIARRSGLARTDSPLGRSSLVVEVLAQREIARPSRGAEVAEMEAVFDGAQQTVVILGSG